MSCVSKTYFSCTYPTLPFGATKYKTTQINCVDKITILYRKATSSGFAIADNEQCVGIMYEIVFDVQSWKMYIQWHRYSLIVGEQIINSDNAKY